MQEQQAAIKEKDKTSNWKLVIIVLQALALAVIFRTFLFQPFTVTGDENHPELYRGDYLFLSKFSYGYNRHSFPDIIRDLLPPGHIPTGTPKRGDVVMYSSISPKIEGKVLDKTIVGRIVGMPGETIRIENAKITVNGVEVQSDSQAAIHKYENYEKVLPTFETFPDGTRFTVEWPVSALTNWKVIEVEVPKDSYYVLPNLRDLNLEDQLALLTEADKNNPDIVKYLKTYRVVPMQSIIGRMDFVVFNKNNAPFPLSLIYGSGGSSSTGLILPGKLRMFRKILR